MLLLLLADASGAEASDAPSGMTSSPAAAESRDEGAAPVRPTTPPAVAGVGRAPAAAAGAAGRCAAAAHIAVACIVAARWARLDTCPLLGAA